AELVAQARDLGSERLIMLDLGEYRRELVASGRRESIRGRNQEESYAFGTLGADGFFDSRKHHQVAECVASVADRLLVGRAVRHAHGHVCCRWKESSRQHLDGRS